MNEKIPVTNNTAMPIYVGAAMIPPGETRHFDAAQVPPEHRPVAPAATPEAPANPLAEMLKQSVSALKELLPSLSNEDLDALGAAEQSAEKPRTTLLSAIAEEILTRADAAQAGAGTPPADPAAGNDVAPPAPPSTPDGAGGE